MDGLEGRTEGRVGEEAERAGLERKRRGDRGGEKESRKALPAITHSVSLAGGCCATIFH